ncbi:nucleotidyl transferase AbiEii/AbiGii toxin family protein [Candidatus Collierbacteria bacterium]|nr:nucleotidyl transferase AbiEii/AbiGii toxin family protein [Candidatus Collierbacteria bacterium]
MINQLNPQKHLTPLQWLVLKKFFADPISAQFFLTGGTALSGFYYHHRDSVDLDLFTLNPFDYPKIKERLAKLAADIGGIYQVRTESPPLLTGFIETGDVKLKVDIVHDIPVHDGEFKVFESIRVDALENIGSNKITAIYGRLAPKDFIDLYWILKIDGKLNFEKLMETAKKKDLGLTEFHLGHIFAGIPENLLFPPTMPSVSPQEIRSFFVDLGNNLLEKAEKPKFG